ncbi:MAG: SCP2 sterol-binding domain-containing protein, partial [Solirubrobacterales bacterium]
RHIGFGVKVLSECFAESDECRQAVAELLRELLPFTLAVFSPVEMAREYTRAYGFELEQLFSFGLSSVRTKWRATGYPMEEMPGVLPVDPALTPDEVATRQIVLLEAGVMGAPNGRPDSSPEIQALHFDMIARVARTEPMNGAPMTIQWRFDDAEPWHVRIDNGSSAAEPGLAPAADLTIESSWQDWIEMSTKGEDAKRLLLRRRVRPRGSLRNLLKMQRIFPARPNRLG